MGNKLRIYKNIGISALVILLVSVLSLTLVIEHNENITTANKMIRFAINNHIIILVVLMVIAVALGFLWSNILYTEIEKKKKDTLGILDVVLLFLSQEERQILNFLVEHNGITTQAEITRLPNMNRVKAFRSLQKMQEKRLVDIIAHGKIRKVQLKPNILETLTEN